LQEGKKFRKREDQTPVMSFQDEAAEEYSKSKVLMFGVTFPT
jgi:hypothetical protein